MLPLPNTIPVIYREPFAFGHTPWIDRREHGETILEIVRSVPHLPKAFIGRGVVCINGEVVPRELWSYVRPKPATDSLPIAVTLHWSLGSPGGGGNSSKSIIGLVAALALVVVTAGIGAGFAGTLLGISSLGAGTFGAAALAGAVGIGGALAIGALTAPPTTQEAPQIADTNTDNKDPAAAQGNVISPGGAIPRVVGSRKVYPPLICEPLVELVDADEYVEAMFALNGPHLLEDIRIDGMPLAEADDIEFESSPGFSDDVIPTLVARQGKTINPQITLSQHVLDSDNLHLEHQDSPEDDLPVWHGFVTRDSPDEVWVHALFPGGISQSGTTTVSVPFRIRARRRGEPDWINFPEVHVRGNSSDQLRLAFLFKWAAAVTPLVTPKTDTGFWYAHRSPPGQTNAPATPEAWVADGYFDDGAGNDYLYAGVEASTRLQNLNLYKNRVEFYLNDVTFVPGIWEIQIKRGHAYLPASFTPASYVFSGSVFDFFWYRNTTPSTILIGQDQDNISDHGVITRVASVWNEAPYTPSDKYYALIAIKARNRQIQRLSVQASGYIFDGDTFITTSNPAYHYIDVLAGEQNLDPLDLDLIDSDGLIAWLALCDGNNWTCDAIIDDMRTQDVLALLASCGYAKPYQSDTYGVTVDNDRSTESPIQVFSRINASNVKFEKAFVRAPEGFIVSYRDESSDDDRAQTIVYQSDPSVATTGLFETITYDGLVETDKVEARARFDLDQANMRSTFHSLETDIESIVCRRGSLVALQHDVLTSRCGDGHVVSKTTVGSNITSITLDSQVNTVADNTGIAIRHTDGSITTHAISNGDGITATLLFTTPISNDGTIVGFNDTGREYGSLVVVGELSSEYKRMLVAQITATKDLKASMVLVDEAPDLERF